VYGVHLISSTKVLLINLSTMKKNMFYNIFSVNNTLNVLKIE